MDTIIKLKLDFIEFENNKTRFWYTPHFCYSTVVAAKIEKDTLLQFMFLGIKWI